MLTIDLSEIAQNFTNHSPTSPYFLKQESIHKKRILKYYESGEFSFNFGGEINLINFPLFHMGDINSSHLFGFNELIIFAYYQRTIPIKYSKILDLGGNIGLHSIILSKLGGVVTAVEPDPIHIGQFRDNLELNHIKPSGVTLIEGAVSAQNKDKVQFTRVTHNTTGSHLKGAKQFVPYGGFEELLVENVSLSALLSKNFDLVKMDIEGSEGDVLNSLSPEHFDRTDFIMEVGSLKNSAAIWKLSKQYELRIFSQKNNWHEVLNAEEMPCHHSEGSIFISRSKFMEW
jgi:FkbM family methyltransferase